MGDRFFPLVGMSLCLACPLAGADVIYVDDSAADGDKDGRSWSDAYTSLQPAIDEAFSSGKPVWVAQGTYTPNSWPNPIGGMTARHQHFSLKNGVSIYGGFAGTETNLDQRDPSLYPVILSGDLNGDDADTNGDGRPEASTTDENCYHVFYNPSSLANAVLDGVTVSGGNADGTSPNNSGGGMCNPSASSPIIANCTIISNAASSGGGAIHNGWSCSPLISNCTIAANWASFGAGIYNSNNASPRIANCTIAMNSATNRGGGICNVSFSSPPIINCTIVSNLASSGGGIYNTNSCSPGITNCILWGNTPTAQQIVNNPSSTPSVKSCVVQNGYSGGANIITDNPILSALGDHGGPTPTMPISTATSPAINVGQKSADIPTSDQRGFARGATNDIGACEFQALVISSNLVGPASIGAQPTFTVFTDQAGVTFQWYSGASNSVSNPLPGQTNATFTTPPLELGSEFWVRLIGGGITNGSGTQSVSVRGTYPNWVAFHGLVGTNAQPGASPAADGIANLIKFASGLDPNAPCIPSDYSTLAADLASNTVSMTWIQSKTPTDVTWEYRQSYDLLAWAPLGIAPTLAGSNAAWNIWQITLPIETNRLFLSIYTTLVSP
ncbi:MAG TPA: choice-of-anchor Q domain-containing protein [Verrucomicrobiae bacterium]|nr:choice-of-anchor Q domain-containing protein [Verrucomicrobiae bacterium]